MSNGKNNINTQGCMCGVININDLYNLIYEDVEFIYNELDDESIGFEMNKDGYVAHSAFDKSCLVLTESPYYTYANSGYRTLCFGHEMFDLDVAPYLVYSVATGELIKSGE